MPSRARASSGPTARSATRDAVKRKARGGHAAEEFFQKLRHAAEKFSKNVTRDEAIVAAEEFAKGQGGNLGGQLLFLRYLARRHHVAQQLGRGISTLENARDAAAKHDRDPIGQAHHLFELG